MCLHVPKYHLDRNANRRKVSSYKRDVGEDELPMWVTDMDFDTASGIKIASQKRIEQGILGYNTMPDPFFEACIFWWRNRHDFTLQKGRLMFCTGTVSTTSSIVRKMTKPGDEVLLLIPVYNIFYNFILNNGRGVLRSPLIYKDGNYRLDCDDLESKLAQPETTLMILCNPHNPTGYAWTKAELEKIGQLCLKHNALILSDEVYCDLTRPDSYYTPPTSVSEEIINIAITCLAPSRAFNIVGLQTSVIPVPSEALRKRISRGINTNEVAEPNSFATQATEAVFDKVGQWSDELNECLAKNHAYLTEQVTITFPEIKIVSAKMTYLVWFNRSAISRNTTALCAFAHQKTSLILSSGDVFNGNGKLFTRWNHAYPLKVLAGGVERFRKAAEEYKE